MSDQYAGDASGRIVVAVFGILAAWSETVADSCGFQFDDGAVGKASVKWIVLVDMKNSTSLSTS